MKMLPSMALPCAACVFAAALTTGCGPSRHAAPLQTQGDPPPPPAVFPWADFRMASQSDVYLGPQPGRDALEAFARRGGAVVVNLRTSEETADLAHVEEAIADLGLRTVRIPFRGAGFGAEEAVTLSETILTAEGPVLVHCGSAARANYLYAAHLINTRGISGAEAANWASSRLGRTWEDGDATLIALAPEPPPRDEAAIFADGVPTPSPLPDGPLPVLPFDPDEPRQAPPRPDGPPPEPDVDLGRPAPG